MNGEEYDFTSILEKPIVIVTFIFLVVFYIIYTYLTGSPRSSSVEDDYYNVFETGKDSVSVTDSISIFSNTFINIIIFLFILFIIIKGYQVLFNQTITASIEDASTNNPKINIQLNSESDDDVNDDVTEVQSKITRDVYDDIGITHTNQVFNIPGNVHTYDSARALCKAYDGRLASYEEIENSYKKGGEWCNYGWSEGQNIYFPTQMKTYKTLQGIKGHENDCGRPGINGGYIANPYTRFGVNCYGKKPIIKPEEKEIMDTTPSYPLNKKDIWFNEKVEYFKKNLDDILVSPFNKKSWSASLI
jgi:hypothetical protein